MREHKNTLTIHTSTKKEHNSFWCLWAKIERQFVILLYEDIKIGLEKYLFGALCTFRVLSMPYLCVFLVEGGTKSVLALFYFHKQKPLEEKLPGTMGRDYYIFVRNPLCEKKRMVLAVASVRWRFTLES